MSESLPPTMMKSCTQCGEVLPAAGTNGLCPACLMAEAMKPSSPAKGPWQPPTAEELAKLLPQYEITRMLGRGGMGAVYQGTQKSLDRPVAIKILSNDLETADVSFAERFKNEARAMAKLSHPGIVAVFDSGETATGLLYIVMEFIEGTDVARMIAQQGRLHTEHAMAITAHVCDALAYAHERGIIHRDIKPANIMVGYDGVVKVADFGLAKMTQSQNSGLTQSGMAMGTLHYMAPEALVLGSAVDHRADIYAVGVMLYQMLTGKIPQGLFELPSLQVPGLDPRYDGIISKALREDREVRYPSVLDMRHDLDAILTQPVVKVEASAEKAPAALETQARPQRPGGQPYRPPQPEVIVRTEKPSSLLLWVFLLMLGGLVFWLYLEVSKQTQPAETPPVVSAPAQPSAMQPAAADVVVPEWLVAAKKRGGKLRIEGSVNGLPATIGEAEKYEDFVEVFASAVGWVARRADGEVYFGASDRQKTTLGRSSGIVNVSMSRETLLTQADGNCLTLGASGVTPVNEVKSPQTFQGVKMYYGSLLFGRSGILLDAAVSEKAPQAKPVHTDLFKGAVQILEGGFSCLGLFADKEPLGWPLNPRSESMERTFPSLFHGSIQADSPRDAAVLLRNAAGQVFFSNMNPTAFDNVTPPPADLGPAIRVRAGARLPNTIPVEQFLLCAAQMTDGTWRAWGSEGPLIEKVNKLGVALDLDASDSDGFLIWIEPDQTALAASGNKPSPTVPPQSSIPAPAVEVGEPPNTTSLTIDLLAQVDLNRDVVVGKWKTSPDGVELEAGSHPQSRLDFPFTPPAEYDFEIEFTPTVDQFASITQCFTSAGRAVTWVMQGQPQWTAPVYAFQPLDGKSEAASEAKALLPRHFKKGQLYRSLVKVRKGSLQALIDGEVIVSWSGDMQRFPERWSQWPAAKALGVGAWGGGIVFHKATIQEFIHQAPPPPLPTGPTTWTDTKGRSITATFKAIASGNVLLDIAGKVTPVPLNTLSAESQKLARAYHDQSSAAAANDPDMATKDKPFTNSLGMKFVPVPGTKVLFCVHETRRKDYAVYAKEVPAADQTWLQPRAYNGFRLPTDDENHPASSICYNDAIAFCAWLGKKEGRTYRLPSDREWSFAVGIGEDESPDQQPLALSGAIKEKYPWGNYWPPTEGDGNYAEASFMKKMPVFVPIAEMAAYHDGYTTTAPVMSFKPNSLGIFDLGGNANEWCQDRIASSGDETCLLRGNSWFYMERSKMRSSYRLPEDPTDRSANYGFRCVIELSEE